LHTNFVQNDQSLVTIEKFQQQPSGIFYMRSISETMPTLHNSTDMLNKL